MRLHTSKERVLRPLGIPNLRSIRQRQGLSLGTLAEMSGLRKTTITHLENGREEPQPYHVRMLARALGVTTLDLV
jgi:transcriptional regulator with XRE-family HTH domain